MARRWTPQRFVTLRRIRVAVCAAAVVVASAATFAVGERKAVALTVNGETKMVTTYATSVPRLLQEQGITTKSHDFVQSSAGDLNLKDHDVVTVRSAYQTTISINGRQVPFWTYATSADQLLGFFKQNDAAAAKVTVNIGNVYNQLTGGLVINKKGPVTVIADGKSSVAPNGKLTAASILDSKGITLGKEDRVNVTEEDGQTVLRVQRVTHGDETRNVAIPYGTRTIVDPSLAPGQTAVRQTGVNGNRQEVYDVTYVDGVAESETLKSQNTTVEAVDEVIAVGPAAPTDEGVGKDSNKNSSKDSGKGSDKNGKDNSSNKSDSDSKGSGSSQTPNNNTDNGSTNNGSSSSTPAPAPAPPAPAPAPAPTTPPASGSNHLPPAEAQIYAAGAAAAYGWTGQQWNDLVTLWNRESGWRWDAANPWSDAYGIPQALPGSKMGPGWHDDAVVQINWGLGYISSVYGNPSNAWAKWQSRCNSGLGCWY
jgi:resuscitation-promoting factor RpfB